MFQIFAVIVLIFSIVLHEFAHGWMANRLGDPTARFLGRLTLNPIPHIDLVGSIILPLLLIVTNSSFVVGWAKPVPYNPHNLKDQKRDPALVALAGPAVNLLLAVIFGILIRLIISLKLMSLVFMIPFFFIIVQYNLLLAVFNLIPIPPLDGSKILFAMLPYSMRNVQEFLEQNYFLFVVLFIFVGFSLISPIITFLSRFIIGY